MKQDSPAWRQLGDTMRLLVSLTVACSAVAWSPHAWSEVASHCKAEEITVWSCRAGEQVHSVCGLPDLSRTQGFLQYRVGKPGSSLQRYPEATQHPSGHFEFALLPQGAALSFQWHGASYQISETLKGAAILHVVRHGKMSMVRCDDATDTLTLNTTIDRMTALGIRAR
jgi:hypothetical protein